jgi:hypothetical protein
VEIGIFFRVEDFVEDHAEAAPEGGTRRDSEGDKKQLLHEGEVAGFSKDCVQRKHRRTKLRYTIVMGAVVWRANGTLGNGNRRASPQPGEGGKKCSEFGVYDMRIVFDGVTRMI